ncbi:MAG: zinc ribbon domain-containing protein [Armatimonadota bacterium]
MSEQLKALYELQKIDTEIAKAQKTRASMDTGTSRRLEVEAAKKEADDANKLLHDATTELRDSELNLKSIESKQKTYQDKLYAGKVTNAKELSSMEKEIEMFGRQKDKLEERILELMDLVEARKSILSDAQGVLKDREDEYAVHMTKARKQAALLAARVKEQTALREEAVKAVDPVLLNRYESMRSRLGGVAVSKVEEGTCSGCHMQISGNIIRELKTDKDIITCENCSRILYLEHK